MKTFTQYDDSPTFQKMRKSGGGKKLDRKAERMKARARARARKQRRR